MASSAGAKGDSSIAQDSVIVSRNKIKYINANFKKVSAIMYDYKCDVKLKCGNLNFKAHRDVLSAASDYFSAMFSHNMKEKEQDVIELHGISPAGISVIFDYFYHGFVTIDPKNIEDILEAARFFQVQWLVDVCCKFLVHHLSIDNYKEVIHLSDKYFLGDLRTDIFGFLGNNIIELAGTPEFFQNLSLELLTQFLKEDIYVEATEDFLLYICHKWVKADLEKRKPYLKTLLRLIRFPLIDPEGIERMPKDFLEFPEIQDAVEEAKHYLNNIAAQSLHNGERFQARGSKLVITGMAFLEEHNELVHKYLPFDQKELCYEQLGDVGLGIDFEYASTAQIGNFMYAVGGYGDDYNSTNNMFRFDPRTRAWTELAAMARPRSSAAMCSSNTHLFICGGVDHQFKDESENEEILKSVETYDPSTNAWVPLPDLVYGSFAQALAYHDNYLYISGGISADPSDPVPIMSVFKLKIGDVGWEPVREMLYPRLGHSLTTVGNKLYCIGGKEGGQGGDGGPFVNCLTNEVYDIETNQWTELCNTPDIFGMILKTVVPHESKLYILGIVPKDNQQIQVNLNYYDIQKNEFENGESLVPGFCKIGLFLMALPQESNY
ncbi:kelch-like protein 36 [Patella vulgata]|uniref:kelch-like protein 36 n=1 Tax=Patella vulgata TaxID=6465 RepID=UPI00218016A4|nr:kelch-like protein 36 [Patella vulgata]XP_050419036.1 kelch-like protein 36 [Patella vulgata]